MICNTFTPLCSVYSTRIYIFIKNVHFEDLWTNFETIVMLTERKYTYIFIYISRKAYKNIKPFSFG